MSNPTVIPVPRSSSKLPKQPIEIIRYLRQFISGDLEHAVCTRDGKSTLGKWLDHVLSKEHQPLDQVKLSFSDKVPFVARCGRLMLLVEKMDDCESGGHLIILRGTIIEGMHFNDRGDYGPGDRMSIGPITDHWWRLTIPRSNHLLAFSGERTSAGAASCG